MDPRMEFFFLGRGGGANKKEHHEITCTFKENYILWFSLNLIMIPLYDNHVSHELLNCIQAFIAINERLKIRQRLCMKWKDFTQSKDFIDTY